MKCPRCGFDAQNMKFCPECGLQMPAQPPVQSAVRTVPVQTANPHVVPMQSAARVSSVQSDAHLTAVKPPKSKNTALLVAAIVIGMVVLSGIVIAALSGIFYNRSVFSPDDEQTTSRTYTTDIEESNSYPER